VGLNVLAGLNVRVTENLGAFIEYKYDKATLHFDRVITVAQPIGSVSLESPYHNSAIVVGLGWHF
jgi:ribosome-associated translation inhibitor RaiA